MPKLPIPLSLVRVVLVAALVVVSTLAVIPISQALAQELSDKLAHGLSFLALAFLADRSLPRISFLPWIALALLGYGLAIELVQARLPYRTFSWADLAADAAGLAVYAVVAWLVSRLRPSPA